MSCLLNVFVDYEGSTLVVPRGRVASESCPSVELGEQVKIWIKSVERKQLEAVGEPRILRGNLGRPHAACHVLFHAKISNTQRVQHTSSSRVRT